MFFVVVWLLGAGSIYREFGGVRIGKWILYWCLVGWLGLAGFKVPLKAELDRMGYSMVRQIHLIALAVSLKILYTGDCSE